MLPPRGSSPAPRLLLSLSLSLALLLGSHALSQGPTLRPAGATSFAQSSSPSSLISSSSPISSSSNLDPPDLPSPSSSGYVRNGGPDRGGGQLFYTYYEKVNNVSKNSEGDPIFLWLEGGPGCASSFGNFYINGPERVLASRDGSSGERRATGKLGANPHAWNAIGGLLYIDQPVGTGFSVPGEESGEGEGGEGGGGEGGETSPMIPRTEVEVAADLYFGLCELFGAGGPLEALASRPLFVTGESYAGKFVPSIAHYILQAEEEAEAEETREGRRRRRSTRKSAEAETSTPTTTAAKVPPLRVRRELRKERGGLSPRPPPFHLAGIAVGNGLVDPGSQILTHASSLYYRGMIDGTERARTMAAALQISVLVRASAFAAAHAARARLLTRLTAVSGVGTLLDTRRYEDYDAGKAVDQYLNLPEVRAALSVNESLYGKEKKKYKEKKNEKNGGRVEADPPPSLPSPYAACSDSVALAMDADVMRSTARLFPDILDSGVRVLVYVGADDVQDGSAATDAWLSRLKWSGSKDFSRSPRRLWELVGAVVDDERYGSGCTEAGGSVGSGVAAGAGFVEMGVLVGVEERVSSPFLNPSSSSPPAPVVGYWRSGGGLDHVTVRNGGHMLPHDQPVVALAMLARWSAEVLSSGSGSSLSSSSSSSVAA